MTTELKPCPFCNQRLYIRKSVNPHGRCETKGCWMHEAKLTVPLNDAVQVSAFNTRTAPDVPELVRYECKLIGDFIDSYGMAEHSDGDYVRYDQVAKVIHGWTTKLFDQVITIEGLRSRVKAAETKLAEYEKQEPVAWQHVNDDGECEQIEYDINIADENYLDPDIQLLYLSPAPCPDLKNKIANELDEIVTYWKRLPAFNRSYALRSLIEFSRKLRGE